MSTESGAAFQEGGGQTHHFSDIDVWKYPDRNYYLFITLSILFGFFGIDHFYLRSFGTGVQKLILNMFTFGLWYFWDLIQIIFDGQKVRHEGLDSPFEWIRGIGRGVFIDPQEHARMAADPTQPVVRTKKDIVIYAILTIMFGIFGLDKLYMGHPWQAVTKCLSVFNILFFLFGLMWVVWDIVHVTLYTDSLLKDGVTLPLPFSLFLNHFSTKDEFIPEIVTKDQLSLEAQAYKESLSKMWIGNWDLWIWNWKIFGGNKTPATNALATGALATGASSTGALATGASATDASSLDTFRDNVFRPLYKELVVPVIQPSVGTLLEKADKNAKVIAVASEIGKNLLSTVPEVAKGVSEKIADVSDPNKLMAKIQAQAAAKALERVGMVGGSLSSDSNMGPIIAGTLSAIMLAGSAKVIGEILSKRTDKTV